MARDGFETLMMLEYPLSVIFKFTFREVEHPSGSFAGVGRRQDLSWRKPGTARARARVINRGSKKNGLLNRQEIAKDNVQILQFEGQHRQVCCQRENGAGESIRIVRVPFVDC